MAKFKNIKPGDITDNPFKLIGEDWMLITAGTISSYNTMTANWGGFGVLWDKNVCFCFVRPIRYTDHFMERDENFTLSFFEEAHRETLQFCGTYSGLDVNKAQKTGLVPVAAEAGGVYFEQARLVIECRKVYSQQLDPARFVAPYIAGFYPDMSYHRLYVGEIVNCLAK